MSLQFSKAISQLRRDSKLSQRIVAQDLGISQALLSHYEKGVRQPKLEFVRKIANYYGVSANDILGSASAERSVSADEQRLLFEINSVIKLEENKKYPSMAELACGYIPAAVANARRIVDNPDCPFDPRRYSEMKSAEAALYDAAKSNGAGK
ncbi:MAG: helix-turn-helix transcriptional regulator [Clostridiales bacterium]|nr:helix-turn-helix transcriptional regulator [Clostridiales bacterium]